MPRNRIEWEELDRPRQVALGQHVEESKVFASRRMRTEPTPAEARLWQALRGNSLLGLKFRRQQIIDGFIADFYCHAAALVVECDGPIHDPGYDAERDRILGGRKLLVLRFPNERILNDLEKVLDEIAHAAEPRLAPQTPPSRRGTSAGAPWAGKGAGGIGKTTDAALVHALTQAAYEEYGRDPGTSTALKETWEAVAAQLAGGAEAVALERDGKPLACVRFVAEGDALYFHRLSVHPDYRRQGLASKLIGYLEDEAKWRGLKRLTCSVRLAMDGNVALYEKLGFVQVGESTVCRDGTPVPTGHLEKRL